MGNRLTMAHDGALIIFASNTNKPFYFDEEDFPLLDGRTWHEDGNGYFTASLGGNKKIHAHQLLIDCPEGLVIDHRDLDKTNNRRSNLRVITQAENARNMVKRGTRNSSKYLGVSEQKRLFGPSKYKVAFRMKYVGLFDSEIEAAIAADKVAIDELGPNIETNFSRGLLTKEDLKQFGLTSITEYELPVPIKREPKLKELEFLQVTKAPYEIDL